MLSVAGLAHGSLAQHKPWRCPLCGFINNFVQMIGFRSRSKVRRWSRVDRVWRGPHPYARSRIPAGRPGVAIREVNAATDDEFDAAFARLIRGQDDRRRYLFPQPAQPTLLAGGTHHRLAPIGALRKFAQAGGLISYGASLAGHLSTSRCRLGLKGEDAIRNQPRDSSRS
jgi:hypothetical protein